jgi:hypothetical protein
VAPIIRKDFCWIPARYQMPIADPPDFVGTVFEQKFVMREQNDRCAKAAEFNQAAYGFVSGNRVGSRKCVVEDIVTGALRHWIPGLEPLDAGSMHGSGSDFNHADDAPIRRREMLRFEFDHASAR